MRRSILLPVVLCSTLFWCAEAAATTCSSYTYTLSNGTTADATQVMADFNDILNCANTYLAPITSPHFAGNVGIGTTAPSLALEVRDTTGQYLVGVFQGAGSAAVALGSLGGAAIIQDIPATL